MHRISRGQKHMSMGCLAMTILLIMCISVGGIATQYTIEYWVPKIRGTQVRDVPFKYYFLGGIVFGAITIPVSIGTLIASKVFEDEEIKSWIHSLAH